MSEARDRARPPAAPEESKLGFAQDRLNLWDWQRDAVAAWRSNGRRGIVEAVTGAGKTRVAFAAIRDCLLINGRVLVLVPTEELLNQWFGNLVDLHPGLRVGRLSGSRKPTDTDHVVVAIVNSATVAVASEWFDVWIGERTVLVVADECHRYAAPTFSRALDERLPWRLGLTATLERTDGAQELYLLPYFDKVVFRLDYSRALADGVVSPWKVVRIGLPLSSPEQAKYDRVRRRRREAAHQLQALWGLDPSDLGFFNRVAREAVSRAETPARRWAVEYMKGFSEERAITATSVRKMDALSKTLPVLLRRLPALVFTTTTQSADSARRTVASAGIATRVVHSQIPRQDRADAMEAFKGGDVQVLLAPRVLDEGVDVPDCKVAFVIGMGSSPRQLKQRLGRIIRKTPTKQWATLFYFFARGTHEDPASEIVRQQWHEVARHAIEVRELAYEDLMLPRRASRLLGT